MRLSASKLKPTKGEIRNESRSDNTICTFSFIIIIIIIIIGSKFYLHVTQQLLKLWFLVVHNNKG
jgi:hypothetical protein